MVDILILILEWARQCLIGQLVDTFNELKSNFKKKNQVFVAKFICKQKKLICICGGSIFHYINAVIDHIVIT